MNDRGARPVEAMVDRVVTCVECGAAFGRCDHAFATIHSDIPTVTHSGVMRIGDLDLTVHVLSDGMRIIDEESMQRFLAYLSEPSAEPESAV